MSCWVSGLVGWNLSCQNIRVVFQKTKNYKIILILNLYFYSWNENRKVWSEIVYKLIYKRTNIKFDKLSIKLSRVWYDFHFCLTLILHLIAYKQKVLIIEVIKQHFMQKLSVYFCSFKRLQNKNLTNYCLSMVFTYTL